MNILYSSTRGGAVPVTASEAILNGLCPDGGLYVPNKIPALGADFNEIAKMSYKQTAFLTISKFFDDYSEEELKACIEKAYDSKFDTEEIAPLVKKGGAYFLELFHGATIAFKDMALSILPHLLTCAARKNGVTDDIVILTATSGDTGKAALAGFADVEGTRIIVFYPAGGVSEIQRLQMVTQKGGNTFVCGVEGNFDDCQSAVKAMFANEDLSKELSARGFRFSSANSINIGRLIPQVAYYVWAYSRLVKGGEIKAKDPVNFVVPTGNFGNILAAYYASLMGVPVNRLICASNENKVLYDFFKSGIYDKNREFILTSSPSMDILISSNLERVIYMSADFDGLKTLDLMSSLKECGKYEITPGMKKNMSLFYGSFADEKEGASAIKSLYESCGYVIDTHTSVAYAAYEKYKKETGDDTPSVIVSTASPYKFANSVLGAIKGEGESGKEAAGLIKELEEIIGKGTVPVTIKDALSLPVRHGGVCKADEMTKSVMDFLNIKA